jgi:hypothetical protein
MAFCKLSVCLFTACFHSSMSGDAELCATSINCAHHSHSPQVPPRRTAILCLPTTKRQRSFLPYHSAATHPLLSLALTPDHNSIQSP